MTCLAAGQQKASVRRLFIFVEELFVEELRKVQQFLLFIIVAFVVEAFGKFLEGCLDDPVV
jgi:hypothetical protein